MGISDIEYLHTHTPEITHPSSNPNPPGSRSRMLPSNPSRHAIASKSSGMRRHQARETKQKARIDTFHKLKKAVRPRPKDESLDANSNNGQRRMGNDVLKLKNVSLTFDTENTNIDHDDDHDNDNDGETQTINTKKELRIMLDDFSYNLNRWDKIGIVGANGVGKVRNT